MLYICIYYIYVIYIILYICMCICCTKWMTKRRVSIRRISVVRMTHFTGECFLFNIHLKRNELNLDYF